MGAKPRSIAPTTSIPINAIALPILGDTTVVPSTPALYSLPSFNLDHSTLSSYLSLIPTTAPRPEFSTWSNSSSTDIAFPSGTDIATVPSSNVSISPSLNITAKVSVVSSNATFPNTTSAKTTPVSLPVNHGLAYTAYHSPFNEREDLDNFTTEFRRKIFRFGDPASTFPFITCSITPSPSFSTIPYPTAAHPPTAGS